MPSPYQDFVRKAKERFAEKQKKKAAGSGTYRFTRHAEYKMQQYGLSEQRVRSVIRNPKRREVGIVPKTVAVMQPVSPKKIAGTPASLGAEVWKQEIWVMFQVKNQGSGIKDQEWGEIQENGKKAGALPKQLSHPQKTLRSQLSIPTLANRQIRIISAWRYPGMSPKRNPIPEDILRELEEGSILETENEIYF